MDEPNVVKSIRHWLTNDQPAQYGEFMSLEREGWEQVMAHIAALGERVAALTEALEYAGAELARTQMMLTTQRVEMAAASTERIAALGERVAALTDALEAAMSWFPSDVRRTGWPELIAQSRAALPPPQADGDGPATDAPDARKGEQDAQSEV